MKKLTPNQAIWAHCRACLHLDRYDMEKVKACEISDCTLFPYRMGKRPPIRIFRQFCIKDCMNGYMKLVTECQIKDCVCWPYRMGRNPALIGKRQPNKGSFVSDSGRHAVKNKRETTFSGQDESII